jgi:hypothetical protein
MKRFSIVLLIRHPNIDPSEISEELKLDPYSSAKAGEPRVTPKGTLLPSISERSSWNHVFEYEVDTKFFEEMEKLLSRFILHKAFFLRISKESGSAQLYVNFPGDINQGDTAKPSMLKLMSELELHLGAEVFPNMNLRGKEELAKTKGITFITNKKN